MAQVHNDRAEEKQFWALEFIELVDWLAIRGFFKDSTTFLV